jgi:F0F1-type ATP synthase assembly protein I
MTQASWGLSLALGFVAVVMACFFIGRWLDGRLGIEPWLQIVGTLIGFVVGSLTVYYGSQRRVD